MAGPVACPRCARSVVERPTYEMRGDEGPETRCLRCALTHPATLLRSAKVSAVVGTFLIAVNQGPALLAAGPLPAALWWKVPLTYLTPFCVSLYGALSNAKRPA